MELPRGSLVALFVTSAVACSGGGHGGAAPDAAISPPVPNVLAVGTAEAIAVPELPVRHRNEHPTRLAEAPNGLVLVSDAMAGGVFIYSAQLELQGELGHLDVPLGVAVDAFGRTYVGDDGLDAVVVYDAAGERLSTIGEGTIAKPNDLAFDGDGNLYVVDSTNNTVRVYSARGIWLRDIGHPGDDEGGFDFPSAIAVSCRGDLDGCEIYVADQGHGLVQVFDGLGTFQRAFGGRVQAFSERWRGRFVRLQSLAIDPSGNVHAADSAMNNVQILDAHDGTFIDSYGGFGTEPGELNLPLDILLTSAGEVVVANTRNHCVEVVHVLP